MPTFDAMNERNKNIVRDMSDSACRAMRDAGVIVLTDDRCAVFDEACAVFLKESINAQLSESFK
jgi:hypothetical protein